MMLVCKLILMCLVLSAIDNFVTSFTARPTGRLSTWLKTSATIKHQQRQLSTTRLNANPRNIAIGDRYAVYAKELTSHKLLSANAEFELARIYKLGIQIKVQKDVLQKSLGRAPSDKEVARALELGNVRMVEMIQERAEEAKAELVRANMRLVFHIARYYKYRGIAYPDLVQEGTFGLIKAIEKYDPEKGFRFSTYASWWIKQSVSRAIAEKSRIIRLPVHIHDLMVSIKKVEKSFISAFNRKPTPVELADRLALPVQKVELLLKCSRDVDSMDDNVYNNNKNMIPDQKDLRIKDKLVSTAVTPRVLSEGNSLRAELRQAMLSLTDREAAIVDLRFGLGDGNPQTLEEIGKQFNVTRERIRQIEARALSKMRHPVSATELKEIFHDPLQTAVVQYEGLEQTAAMGTPKSSSSTSSTSSSINDSDNKNSGSGGWDRKRIAPAKVPFPDNMPSVERAQPTATILPVDVMPFQ